MKVDIFNTNEKYDIIYADPPWQYKQVGSLKSRSSAQQHYNTMCIDDICNLPINNIKKDTTILLMWATFPQMADALQVIKSWGFIYKTCAFVWIKKNKKTFTNFWGMGAYTRANSEICLIAVSKKTKAKEMVKSHKVQQVIESAIEEHSKKPDIVRDKIIELFGKDTKKIELFARQEVYGFDAFGNEI